MVGRSLLTLSLLLIFCSGLYGQIGDIIGKKQSRTKQTSKNETTVIIETLAKKIARDSRTDSEKVYAIYHWIATNIVYDNQLRLNTDLQKEIYVSEENVIMNVLERRKALCGGFAFLFKALCNKVGISAEVVHGFTKNYLSDIPDDKTPTHTWNAVNLNGHWELLDITWAIAHGQSNVPDDFWYRTNPVDFIYSHYPEDPKWILLPSFISFDEFYSVGGNKKTSTSL